jgi:hypothetical protein
MSTAPKLKTTTDDARHRRTRPQPTRPPASSVEVLAEIAKRVDELADLTAVAHRRVRDAGPQRTHEEKAFDPLEITFAALQGFLREVRKDETARLRALCVSDVDHCYSLTLALEEDPAQDGIVASFC